MLTILYGLGCALFYGSADYAGGRASRTSPSVSVTASSQIVGMLFVIVLVPFFGGNGMTVRILVVGALGGLCGALGLILLYWLLSIATISVVSPITATTSAVVPVVAGALIGEGLTTRHAVGVVLAIAAIALISRGGADDSADHAGSSRQPLSTAILGACLLAGVFFGLFVVALDRAGDDVGVWPLLAAKPVGVLVAIAVAKRQRVAPFVSRTALPLTAAAGLSDMTANVFATLSAQSGQVAIAGVLLSLYPASTVILARFIDHERFEKLQLIGFAVAVAGLALIALN